MEDTFTMVKVILLLYLAGLTEAAPIANAPLREPESTSKSIACVPFASSDADERDRNTIEEFRLQQMLLAGFRQKDVNRYNISQGGFTSDADNIPPPCIPVQYYIDECPNDTYIYIWTVFNARSETGNTLLKLTVYDLRVFGFELCDIYKPPVDINILLPPEAEPDKDCQMMKKALIDFTTLLPGLSGGEQDASFNTTPTAKGYAIQWCKEEVFKKYSDDKIANFTRCLLATSKLLIIAFCYEGYRKLVKHKIHRKTHKWYYFYWAIQILIFAGMIIFVWFAFKHQKNIHSRITFFVSLLFDVTLGIIMLIVLLSQKGYYECCKHCWEEESANVIRSDDDAYLVPPPLSLFCQLFQKQQNKECGQHDEQKQTSGLEQPNEKTPLFEQRRQAEPNMPQTTAYLKEQHCTHCWTILTNTASFIMFIASMSYLTQALPAIAISYYINPTASLIKLGFFELGVIILVAEIAFLLYLIDKFVWLCYVHHKKEIPDEVYEDKEISDKDHSPTTPSPANQNPPSKIQCSDNDPSTEDNSQSDEIYKDEEIKDHSPTATSPANQNPPSKIQCSDTDPSTEDNSQSDEIYKDEEINNHSPTVPSPANQNPPLKLSTTAAAATAPVSAKEAPSTTESLAPEKPESGQAPSVANPDHLSVVTSEDKGITPLSTAPPPQHKHDSESGDTPKTSPAHSGSDIDLVPKIVVLNAGAHTGGSPHSTTITFEEGSIKASWSTSKTSDLRKSRIDGPSDDLSTNKIDSSTDNFISKEHQALQSPKKKKTIKYIEQYLINGTEPKLISFGHWKCSYKSCHWLFFTSAFQIIVALLLIGMSAPLLYFIMNIIIDQTSSSNDQFKDILAIIPTIAINTWLLFKYGNISHTIKDILGKATKSAMEHHDNHCDHYHHHGGIRHPVHH